MKNKQERKLQALTMSLLAIMVITSCTKKRAAELPEDAKTDIYAISEFGTPSAASAFSASREDVEESNSQNMLQALDTETTSKLSSDEVNVPSRMKFMFDRLPMIGQSVKNFKITFSVDKNTLTAYKVADSINDLTALEKSIAITARQAQLLTEVSKASGTELKTLMTQQKSAALESDKVKAGQAQGALLVPMFKYQIVSYGVLQRVKNDLKEETATLTLKDTDFKNATHIKINSLSDAREVVGLKAGQTKQMNELFLASKLENQVSTAGELASRLKIGLKFIDADAKILTKVDSGSLLVYEVTTFDKLSENQQRLLKNNASNGTIKRCSDEDVATAISSKDENCVIIMTASVQLEHVKPKLSLTDSTGSTSSDVELEEVSASESVGLVQIRQQTPAVQVEMLNNTLDPNSTLVISDLKGEFFFRRTLENAANAFLGKTGMSGDTHLVKFELEDERIVVRNQLSLISISGQGTKDKEEMMSIPVRYLRAIRETANGTKLAIPKWIETTKEKAEVAQIDWTRNSVPDTSSPMSIYDMGSCIRSESSQKVTATDMRLATDGVLNLTIASSYSVDYQCAASKDMSFYSWGANTQFNYNLEERISFMRHTNKNNTDKQFSLNISPKAQQAFNFNVFTLGDLVKGQGIADNRDGAEKYMPMIHDFRNGRVVTWYLGGINDKTATNAKRREVLVRAAKQVIDEWNASFHMAFKGTALARAAGEKYVDIIIEEPGKETGRLGDLDRNYIWFNELPADNGLLGVAQPWANPKSGVIESANVIVYTGNTFESTEALLRNSKFGREYEKDLAKRAKDALAQEDGAKKAVEVKAKAVQTPQGQAQDNGLQQMLTSLKLDNQNVKNVINKLNKSAKGVSGQGAPQRSAEMFQSVKGKKVALPTNADTFVFKMTELAMDKSLQRYPSELEFKMNEILLQHGGLAELTKQSLAKRQAQLSFAMRFERNQMNRPGCFKFSRNEIEDKALELSTDPEENLMLNFENAVKFTLSHELGHAFGLMHNFMASTDQANFEFEGEQTNRNYSSVMDYMPDIEITYAGPGPYDVHAVRAAYTGLVELDPAVTATPGLVESLEADGAKIVNGNLISIDDAKTLIGGETSLVHFGKDTLNPTGYLRYFAQCNDYGVGVNVMCARFDHGATPLEIVKNKIADYHRGYARNYNVLDRISFDGMNRRTAILNSVRKFAEIRGFLDQAFIADFYGSGLTPEANAVHADNLFLAALEGYKFFHEVIRIADTGGLGKEDVLPYLYPDYKLDQNGQRVMDKNGKPVIVAKAKVLEARRIYDSMIDDTKYQTLGIAMDKRFALDFLLTASQINAVDDSQQNLISFIDFEKIFLSIREPSKSLSMKTLTDVLTDNLTVGFFAESGRFIDTGMPLNTARVIGVDAAINGVISLNQSKWSIYDTFAESLLVARSYAKNAPQDRVNVVRLGQDRKKSDTVVYHAAQNAIGADLVIREALKPEILLSAKKELGALMKAMIEADGRVQGASDTVAAKAEADAEAAKVVAKITELNGENLLVPAANIVNEVNDIRVQSAEQLVAIDQALASLKNAKAEEIQQTISKVVEELSASRKTNDVKAKSSLIAFAQSVVVEAAAAKQIQMANGQKLTGGQIAGVLLNANKLAQSQANIIESIDKLSMFTRYVDLDITGTN